MFLFFFAAQRFDHYDVIDHPLDPDVRVSIHLREKRGAATVPTPSDSSPLATVATNAGVSVATKANETSVSVGATIGATLDTFKPLLGVNGTGQRKDASTNATVATSIVSDPISADDGKATKPLLSATANPQLNSMPVETKVNETIIDSIDLPDADFNKTLTEHDVAEKEDYYQYYNSTTVVDAQRSKDYWSIERNYTVSNLLSTSHRRAIVSVVK